MSVIVPENEYEEIPTSFSIVGHIGITFPPYSWAHKLKKIKKNKTLTVYEHI